MSDTKRPESSATPQGSTGAPESADERRGRGPDRRQSVVDRRTGAEVLDAGVERTGLERRRGPGRRRSDYTRSAEEGEMTPEQFLFVTAIDAFKRVNRRPFPTWTEVLEVMRRLGYRKTASSELTLSGVVDWTEPGDAPAMAPKLAAEDEEIEAEDEAA